MRLRHAAPIALLSGLALMLAACGSGSEPEKPRKPLAAVSADPSTAAPRAEDTPSPRADDSDDDTEEETDDADAGATSADLTAPGAVVENGEWITYDWENYDGDHAVLQSRLTGITRATEEEMAAVVAANPDFQGYQMVYVTWETRKVSGDSILYNSSTGDFRPATTEGDDAQNAFAFGGPCQTDYFDEGFDSGGETISGCEIGLEIAGGKQVGGLLFTGPSSADENPFRLYDGSPVFLKG